MGAIRVHDRRPGSDDLPVDEYGYGPLLDRRHGWHPLDIGDEVTLADGSRWPVVSSRIWRTSFGWRQSVAVGVDVPAPETATSADWAALARLAG